MRWVRAARSTDDGMLGYILACFCCDGDLVVVVFAVLAVTAVVFCLISFGKYQGTLIGFLLDTLYGMFVCSIPHRLSTYFSKGGHRVFNVGRDFRACGTPEGKGDITCAPVCV